MECQELLRCYSNDEIRTQTCGLVREDGSLLLSTVQVHTDKVLV